MCTGFNSRKGERKQMTVARCSTWLTLHSCVCPPLLPPLWILIHKGNSCIHICLDYATLPGDEEFFCGGERRAEGIMGGREGGREGKAWKVFAVALNEILFGGGTQLGNIRTRMLLVSVHTQSCRNRSIYMKLSLLLRRRPCILCLLLSQFFHFPLPFLVFLHLNFWLSLLLSHLFQFVLCCCGFTSRNSGAFGVADCWTAAACCAADVMGESCIDSHPLVSSETRVVAQFHPS